MNEPLREEVFESSLFALVVKYIFIHFFNSNKKHEIELDGEHFITVEQDNLWY